MKKRVQLYQNRGKLFHVLYLVSVILVFLVAVSLRAVEVINGNYLFGFDMGRDYLAAYNIAVNHKLTLIGAEVGAGSAGISGLFHGPGYFYLLALMYLLFRGDPYGGLLLMFLFGMGAVLVTFWSVRKMFGKAAGILAFFLVSVAPLIAPQSRFIWNSHPTSFFIIWVLYFAYNISKNPGVYAPLAIFTAGFIYNFELAIAVPMVLALCISLPVVYRIKDIRTYIYSIVAAIAAFSPFLFFEMRHGWMAVRTMFSYTGANSVIGPNVGRDVWFLRLTDHWKYYIGNAYNSFPIERGLLPQKNFEYLALVLFVLLVIFAWKVKDLTIRKFFQYCLITLFVTYGVFYFLNNAIWNYYLIHAHFIYILIFAYAAVLSFKNVRTSWIAKIASIFVILFLSSIVVSSVNRIIMNYKYDYSDLGGFEKIQGKKMAIDYIYQDAKGEPFSEFTFMPPVYTYPYEYLFQTYAKKKYGYVPGSEKKGLVYLIIEPDYTKEWSYKGWLETVIVGGTVIDTVTLKTGHIIQKRQFPL